MESHLFLIPLAFIFLDLIAIVVFLVLSLFFDKLDIGVTFLLIILTLILMVFTGFWMSSVAPETNVYESLYIDGKPYMIRILSGGQTTDKETGFAVRPNEWDTVLDTLGEDNEVFHSTGMLTLCRDTFSIPNGRFSITCAVLRGGIEPRAWEETYQARQRKEEILHVGYRPVLVPLDPVTFEVDPNGLDDIEDGTIITAGTLYMNGVALQNPQNPTREGDVPKYIEDAELFIDTNSTDQDTQIHWVKAGNLLVADRVLLSNVYWVDLDKQNLVDGILPMKEIFNGWMSTLQN